MDDRKFWMVWNKNGNPPRHPHPNEPAAIKEAERLAAQNPGQRFYVLEALCAREVNIMHRVELRRHDEALSSGPVPPQSDA